jgi:hypothetical protein
MACPYCIAWFTDGHSVCPSCQGQREAHAQERRLARRSPLSPQAHRLLARGVYPPMAVADQAPLSRRAIQTRRPHRREVFRLTGQYFPEPVAGEMLVEIQRHRWLEAEKAGRDIWVERDPENPHRAAVADWLGRFFRPWREHAAGQACPC